MSTSPVYPNPTSNSFTISGLTTTNRVVVRNLLGQHMDISLFDVVENRMVIDASLWSQGVYMIEVWEDDAPMFKERVSIVN